MCKIIHLIYKGINISLNSNLHMQQTPYPFFKRSVIYVDLGVNGNLWYQFICKMKSDMLLCKETRDKLLKDVIKAKSYHEHMLRPLFLLWIENKSNKINYIKNVYKSIRTIQIKAGRSKSLNTNKRWMIFFMWLLCWIKFSTWSSIITFFWAFGAEIKRYRK